MAYVDRIITCVSCGQGFTFSASEQELFASRGFTNEPKRCPECRAQRRATMGGSDPMRDTVSSAPREMYEVPCAGCGQIARVPFQPKGVRPVYCYSCFQKNKSY